ncbi:carboxymuconolactone decarboxylase family protein [Microbacterium sp. zg.B48]|uniref:carboxymuconolactone decarboxylase family protein n=1 Tax=unclassified Microbacterium TaxID=2609290 RepID=UPI00214AC621|nr:MULTISPECIES: carboxymuconolactone decarboxylase family protein [unclassified Microbacterium]MCR2762535.1 carboxymuconolactone decarboxylase family protein [Microbacterium sp. zg.B48]MCR2810705.1 carboxymuconolactone decarboxylase family protein [Microbacterium sp. zg.B185]WIM18241.1 carboxymuconolactone decarboxylase family protein [Microbacterium sp. zg-B185]
MAARVRSLTPGELTPDQRELYETITGGPRAAGTQHFALTAADGSLRGPFDLMLRSPAVGTAQQELGAAIRYRTRLSDRMRELAILLVAAHADSAFERESHEAIARAIGFTDDELAAIRALDVSGFTAAEGVVGRATVALLAGDLPQDAWDEASAVIGEDGIFELTALVGYYSTLALQLRVFRVG